MPQQLALEIEGRSWRQRQRRPRFTAALAVWGLIVSVVASGLYLNSTQTDALAQGSTAVAAACLNGVTGNLVKTATDPDPGSLDVSANFGLPAGTVQLSWDGFPNTFQSLIAATAPQTITVTPPGVIRVRHGRSFSNNAGATESITSLDGVAYAWTSPASIDNVDLIEVNSGADYWVERVAATTTQPTAAMEWTSADLASSIAVSSTDSNSAVGMDICYPDTDDDGAPDIVDTDPADPCSDPADPLYDYTGSCGSGDTDGDGILDTDELPGEALNPCVDSANAAWVELATNDCDSDGVTADLDVDDYDMCVDDTGPTGACEATAVLECGVVTVFDSTGADQAFVVPADVNEFTVRAWGAGGAGNDPQQRDISVSGAGGYAEAVIDVATAGSTFSVMVGGKGQVNSALVVYGFGGGNTPAGSGGGLSGLFSGAAAITATDTARAVVIAGGGGGSDYATPAASNFDEPGGSGGDPVNSGGEATMQGATGVPVGSNTTSGAAGGGGGYSGGSAHQRAVASGEAVGGEGGSSFIDTAMIVAGSDKLVWTPEFDFTAPHQIDPYYDGTAATGNEKSGTGEDGLVVIEYIVDADSDGIGEWTGTGAAPAGCDSLDVDSDGDGILDADETPGEENDPCLDPTHADWVELPTNDCDGDGSTVGDGDTTDTDPCIDPSFTNWVELPTNDCDGDGSTVGDGDTTDTDPCVDPTFTNWVALATNDCDNDGVTVGAGDMDDFDVCVDDQGALASCVDTDGDGVTDDIDADPADPCVDPADAGWTQQATNDCDMDGTTVGGGDSVDTDPCVDFTTAPATNDCDGDGSTVGDGDTTDTDPCVDPTFTNWVALATNDCDNDGVTVGAGDMDDFDVCVDDSGPLGSCVDTDGDGVTDDIDADPADPCVDPADAGWTQQATNDCDNDGTTVGGGDSVDTDPCVDFTTAPATNDCDGDGSTVGDGDTTDTDPCVDPTFTNWVALATNDCDNDGVTVGAGDMDDFDVCVDDSGPLGSCVDSDGDGVTDDIDADPTDPCVDPADAGWTQQATNDCDNDGTTVGGGDSVDTDPCVDFTTAPVTNDCDGDGSTVGGGDTTDTDPCVDPTFTNWVALATNDCDNDGVTVGAGDMDDFDVCVDDQGALGSCVDSDGDGVTDDIDADPNDPCVDPADAGWTQQATNDCDMDGTTVGGGDSVDTDPCVDFTTAPATNDCDGDGSTVGDGDTTDTDPCVDPTFVNWVALATNDCDNDGVTVGDGDQDDFDVCVDAGGALASCVDSDGDGVTDDLDTDPADPCVDPADAGWTQQATNDCDMDGTTVGGGDSVDTDPCVDFTTAPATNDCDGDGSTVGDGDTTDTDPCIDPTFTNWVALATNDCDNDGVTVGAGDQDDFDVCVDDKGALGSCVDTDGDGVTDDVDSAPNDPCVDPANAAWMQQASNDCDGDGTTVGGGDSVDTDPCVDFTTALPTNDCDMDGTTVGGGDSNDANPCVDPTTAPASNDCDGDGVTVGDGDVDDNDVCVDSTGKICYDVTGVVWFDLNQDGVLDPTEVDISGVTVNLMQGGNVIATQMTSSPYTFTDIAPGNYTVVVDTATLPAWLSLTFDVDTNLDSSVAVSVVNTDIVARDFGYAPQSLTGQLIYNGTPVPNTIVTITDSAGNDYNVLTDANGNYEVVGSLTSAFYPGAATVEATVEGEQLSQTVQVLGATASAQDLVGGSPEAPDNLAFTGSDSRTPAYLAMLFMFAGMAFIAMRSTRRGPVSLKI